MLKKGQVAKSTIQRQTKIDRSVRALAALIDDALIHPSKMPPALLAACDSQGSLAALDLASADICAVSLNTLKAAAERVIMPGGWQSLNANRKVLRAMMNKTDPLKKRLSREKAARERQATDKGRLEEATRHRAIINRAYFDSLSILRRAAVGNPDLGRQLARHQATFAGVLSMQIVDSEE